MKCSACGKENVEGARFCNECGKVLAPPAPPPERRCPSCGAVNADYVIYCGSCGAELPKTEKRAQTEPTPAVAATSVEAPSVPKPTLSAMTECPYCRAQISIYEQRCHECGNYLIGPETDISQPVTRRGTTAGGVLLILSGVLGLYSAAVLLLAGSMMVDLGQYGGDVTCCGFVEVLFAFGAIAAGVFALKGSNFTLCILGGIMALFTVGPLFAGSILGLIGLIMVATNKENFD